MKITCIGLDLAKTVFQVHGVDSSGKVVLRKQLKRHELLEFLATLDRTTDCVIGMESCCGAEYWARACRKLGYDARIMNPSFVKPYVKGNKNDANDAAGICEAADRPSMRFVPVKSQEQQDLMLLHNQRAQSIKRRTALANQLRGLLMGYGIVVDKSLHKLRQRLPEILEDAENELSSLAREIFAEMRDELTHLDQLIAKADKKVNALATTNEGCRRLMEIPGIGPVSATAYVAVIGDGNQFKNGRQCAAYLGLTPKQHSSGGRETLLGISKRGHPYMRTLLVHGARASLTAARKRQGTGELSRTDAWALALAEKRHTNVAVVALANKNARIAWSVLRHQQAFDKEQISNPG